MAKKSKKTSREPISNTIKIVLGVLILLGAFVVWYLLHLTSSSKIEPPQLTLLDRLPFHQTQARDDLNEDQLSMYQLPKDVVAALNQARSSGNPVLGIRADGPSYHIPILMYHYVEHVKDPGDKIRISLNTPPEVLNEQIKTLVDAHFTFLTPSDLADILDGIKQPPEKPILLTFDDGYRDFYTDAFPIIKKYNIKATNYVISGFLGEPNNLTEDQLKEIEKSGLVEIGAHTVDHPALASVSPEKAKEEIDESRIDLEKEIGVPVTAFAYPYGSFNLTTIQLVKEAGYRTAVSTIPGSEISNDVRFFAYRMRPGYATGQTLISELEKKTTP